MDGSVETEAELRDDAELSRLAAEAEGMDPGPPPAGGEHLPAETEPEVSTAEMLNGLLVPGFAILAPNWDVQHQECKALADAWAPIADKYLGSDGAGSPWVVAVATTLAVVGPRVHVPRHPPSEDQADAEPEAKRQADPKERPAEADTGGLAGTVDLSRK